MKLCFEISSLIYIYFISCNEITKFDLPYILPFFVGFLKIYEKKNLPNKILTSRNLLSKN